MKSNSIIDRFLLKIFIISKVLSAAIVCACILTAIYTGSNLFLDRGKTIDVPKFATVQSSLDDTKSQQSPGIEDYAGLGNKQEIEKKYGGHIKNIIKEYQLTNDAHRIIVADLLDMDKKYRTKYVDGLDAFFKDAVKYIKDKGNEKDFDIALIANNYRKMFFEAIEDVKASEIEAASNKMYQTAMFGASIIILLAFVIIPLLIRIEENTRKMEN